MQASGLILSDNGLTLMESTYSIDLTIVQVWWSASKQNLPAENGGPSVQNEMK